MSAAKQRDGERIRVTADLGQCPDDWSDGGGFDESEVRIGQSLVQSGPAAAAGKITTGMELYFDSPGTSKARLLISTATPPTVRGTTTRVAANRGLQAGEYEYSPAWVSPA